MSKLEHDDRRVGTQGYMLLSEQLDLGVDGLKFLTQSPGRSLDFTRQPSEPAFVPIRMWSARVSRKHSDVTSSVHFDPESNVVWEAALPCAASMEVRVEGVFRLTVLPATVMAALYDGAAFSRVKLGFDKLNPFCEGVFSVSDFLPVNPIDDVVSFAAVLRSYGVVKFAQEPVG
jgi:predicted secreted protein